MRPANIMTAISDVLAGAAIAMLYSGATIGGSTLAVLLLLVLAAIGLYGGGVVFNDVFDAELDAKERPERPIPSGRVSVRSAALLGSMLFLLGVVAAALAGRISGAIAVTVVMMCLLYDKWAKHHGVAGPLAMGLCRGLNLLLGISFATDAIGEAWFLAGIPVLYIAAVTTISRGEVHGGQRTPLLLSAIGYAVVIGLIAYVGMSRGGGGFSIAMLVAFGLFVYPPLVKAIRSLAAPDIGKSVKYGVLGLIFMNAAWTATTDEWGLTVVVLSLFPLSIWLSKLFSVT